MKRIEQMEKKYGIFIRDDSFYDPLKQKFCKRYRIYTADGCQWENGLSFRGLQAECKRYGDTFKKVFETTLGKGGIGMKKIYVWDIVWDVDDDDEGNYHLPSEVIIDDLPLDDLVDLSGWLNGDLADELSDRYGYCVDSFRAEISE